MTGIIVSPAVVFWGHFELREKRRNQAKSRPAVVVSPLGGTTAGRDDGGLQTWR